MKTIAIVNRRGGVGKTVTCCNLGAGLRQRGYSVLLCDLDSQCNLTFDVGAGAARWSTMEVLEDVISARQAIVKTDQCDLLPGSERLASADLLLTGKGKECHLRDALQPLDYDFCLLDTPPALNVLTTNALTAADGVIIPAQAEIHSLQGIAMLYDTISAVRNFSNPDLTICGILLTRYNGRTVLAQDMRDNLQATAGQIGTRLYDTPIRECTALKEAQAVQQDIFRYAARSNGAKDYGKFIDEFLKGLNDHGKDIQN